MPARVFNEGRDQLGYVGAAAFLEMAGAGQEGVIRGVGLRGVVEEVVFGHPVQDLGPHLGFPLVGDQCPIAGGDQLPVGCGSQFLQKPQHLFVGLVTDGVRIDGVGYD